MNKKVKIIFEILFIVAAVCYYYIKIFIPEYQAKKGSSDSFIRTEKYSNMVEVSIDNITDFAFVFNDKKEVYHIFFFHENASCLYNKNIEGNKFQEAIPLSIQLLIENNYLKSTSLIKVIRYGNKDYKKFLKTFIDDLNRYGISNVSEEENTLEKKSQELGLGENKKNSILFAMDMYSKEKGRN